MNVADTIIPWIIVIALLYPIRRLEQVLHQHIFKVGWLFTKNMRRTTILYYVLFSPGVALNQFMVWLIAGLVNVRAESTIAWPEPQEIAELKLNFVKLPRNVHPVKLAFIGIAPMLTALIIIAFITNNILNGQAFVAILNGTAPVPSASVDDPLATVSAALRQLFAIPDLWLWLWLIIALANTMMPDSKTLRGWRPVLIAIVIAVVIFYALGVGDAIMTTLLGGSLANVLSGLGLTFGLIIAVDLFTIGVLGAVEAIFERITGDSATYQNGKLVAMRRDEVIKLREQQREKAEKQAKQESARPAPATSIYELHFPIPGAPGKLSTTQDDSPEPAEAEPV